MMFIDPNCTEIKTTASDVVTLGDAATLFGTIFVVSFVVCYTLKIFSDLREENDISDFYINLNLPNSRNYQRSIDWHKKNHLQKILFLVHKDVKSFLDRKPMTFVGTVLLTGAKLFLSALLIPFILVFSFIKEVTKKKPN